MISPFDVGLVSQEVVELLESSRGFDVAKGHFENR